MVGSLTARFETGTSTAVLSEVQDELLFFVRTSMASGKYESAKVRKVIYVETLSNSPQESNVAPPNTSIVWQPQSEGNSSSSLAAIMLSLLVLILIGISLVVFVTRRRRRLEPSRSEECTITESKPDDTVSTTLPPTSSTEEAWRKALDTEETWRHELNEYDDKSTKLYLDSDEEALDQNAGRRISPSEPHVEQMIYELGNGDGRVGYVRSEVDADCDQSAVHDESNGTTAVDKEKNRRRSEKKGLLFRDEQSPFAPMGEHNMRGFDMKLDGEQNQFDSGHEENVEDVDRAMEPIDNDGESEPAIKKNEEGQKVGPLEDEYSDNDDDYINMEEYDNDPPDTDSDYDTYDDDKGNPKSTSSSSSDTEQDTPSGETSNTPSDLPDVSPQVASEKDEEAAVDEDDDLD